MELSDEQAIRFARFAQMAASVEDARGFERLVEQHVAALLPHGMLLAVIGQRRFDHLHIRHRIGVRYPPWLLQRIPDDINIRERPVIERWLASRRAEVIDLSADRGRLSPREIQEIESLGLGRLAAGRSNQEIAQLRGRSPATIRNQLDKLYGKLRVGSRAEAVALALSEGHL